MEAGKIVENLGNWIKAYMMGFVHLISEMIGDMGDIIEISSYWIPKALEVSELINIGNAFSDDSSKALLQGNSVAVYLSIVFGKQL